jgi:hypothetical protein
MEWPEFMVCLQRSKLTHPPITSGLIGRNVRVGRNSLGSGAEIIVKSVSSPRCAQAENGWLLTSHAL